MPGIRKALIFGLIFFFLSPSVLRAQEWIYTVRPGDNLWDLSERYLSSMRYWPELQRLNRISDPKKLRPGTRLKIPLAWLKIQAAPVRVLALSGEVFFESASRGSSQPLSVGALLQIEDVIRTGPKSSATLAFADGSRLFLQANSHLVFDVIRTYGASGMVDSRIRLQEGRLRTKVSPREDSGTRFELQTPGAITAVRGTELRVTSDAKRDISSTEVLKGRVDVMAGGEIQSVRAGFGTVVKAGAPPAAPRALLEAPALSGLPKALKQLPLRFIWPNLAGARRYRIQLSQNEVSGGLHFEGTLKKAQLILSDLPNGSYVLRVRGIDLSGLEGFNAVHYFVLKVPPPPPPKPARKPPPPIIQVLSKPPLLLNPQPDDVIDLEIPEFEWEAVLDANLYHFQLSDQPDFIAPILERIDLSKRKINVKRPLKPGVYYWRVAAADPSGKYGLFSPSQTFKVRSKPSRLTLATTHIKKTQLQIRWQGGKPDERYQVELARDADFRALVFQEEFAAMDAMLDRPDPGLYYLRVRALTPEGLSGAYTESQTITVPSAFCCPLFLLSLAGLLAIL